MQEINADFRRVALDESCFPSLEEFKVGIAIQDSFLGRTV
jgi:hypothetical protein